MSQPVGRQPSTSKQRGVLLATTAVYWLGLIYFYVSSVAPINENSFSFQVSVDSWKLVESLAITILSLSTVPTRWERPSHVAISLLYFVGLVPTSVIFALSDQPRPYMYSMVLGYAAVTAVTASGVRVPRVAVRLGYRAPAVASTALIGLVLIWYFAVSDSPMPNFDLIDVYDYRDAAKDTFRAVPMNYISSWAPRVLNPFLICYFLNRRNLSLTAFFLLLQILLLGVYQEKMVFIPAIFIPLLYAVRAGVYSQAKFILSLVLISMVCEAAYLIFDQPLGIQIFVRRFFFSQQFYYFNYYEAFQELEHVYLRDSILTWFSAYPMDYAPATMVVHYFTGIALGNPNVGFLATGFMHFGYVGVPLWGGVIGLVLKIFDRSIPPTTPMWFFAGAGFLPLLALLVAQDLPPSFLTGGVAPLLLLMQGFSPVDRVTRPCPSAISAAAEIRLRPALRNNL